MTNLNEINNWKQEQALHCPAKKCFGMLLESSECYEYKCSDCGKYWLDKTEWIEVPAWKEDTPDEIILDMLWQCCSNENLDEIDNGCLSAFEDACSYLERKGYLQNINGRIYKVIKKSKIFNHIEGIK